MRDDSFTMPRDPQPAEDADSIPLEALPKQPAAAAASADSVDWSLLPGNPTAFFGLAAGFSRQDLKRSYSRLIRTYKPETHPGEFQQIRAAYEQLDAQVRYGSGSGQQASAFATAALWEAASRATFADDAAAPAEPASRTRTSRPEETTSSPSSDRAKPPPSPQPTARPASMPAAASTPSIASRLAQEPAAKVYQQLAKAADKSPYDFYVLAVLADVLLPDDPHGFLKWLLAGLKQHRDEAALARLLQEHLRSDVATAELPKALLAVSKVVTSDRFYFLTEAAWDRLLRDADFSIFRRALAACEANLHDYRIAAKTVFYVHLLRAALWKADDIWLDEAFRAVEANAGEMDPTVEADWELTLLAREYRRHAERFAAGGRLRRRMDQTIRAFCTQPSLEAARALIECQNEIAHDAFGVMESFPIPNSDNLSQVVPLWQMIVAHIADEFGIEPPEVNEVRLRRQTLAVLADLRTEIDPVAIKYTRFRRVVMLSWLATLVGGPIVMVVGVIPLRLSWPFLLLWPLAAVGLHGYLLLPKYLDPWLQKRLEKQFQSLYQSTWRPRMFRHLHALAVPAHVMLQQLIVVAREMGDDQWLGWLFEFLQADEGFPLYAAAQPFVR